jgi:hypothetical protein
VRPTHWKQTVFYLEKKLEVEKDQILKGKITVKRSPINVRGLKVVLTIDGNTQTYSLD